MELKHLKKHFLNFQKFLTEKFENERIKQVFSDLILQSSCTNHIQKTIQHYKVQLFQDKIIIECIEDRSYEIDLNFELKFQRIQKQTQTLITEFKASKKIIGFRLIKNQDFTELYFKEADMVLWDYWLSRLLNQVNFAQNYKFTGTLGKGSSAKILEVVRLSDSKKLATKVFMKNDLQNNQKKKASIIQEIAVLRQINHKNNLYFEAVLQTERLIFLVTEKLEGGNILQRINHQQRGFYDKQKKEIMKGILEGILHLHNLNFIHRDIKLQNIMFRGKDCLEPVIVDFGFAVSQEQQKYMFYQCGTPGYMPPESFLEGKGIKIYKSWDMFSLGVLFHVLLTDKYLFEGEDRKVVLKKNKQMNFKLEGQIYNSIDPISFDLLKKMLLLDSKQRITAEQSLKHPFITKQYQKEQLSIQQTKV